MGAKGRQKTAQLLSRICGKGKEPYTGFREAILLVLMGLVVEVSFAVFRASVSFDVQIPENVDLRLAALIGCNFLRLGTFPRRARHELRTRPGRAPAQLYFSAFVV